MNEGGALGCAAVKGSASAGWFAGSMPEPSADELKALQDRMAGLGGGGVTGRPDHLRQLRSEALTIDFSAANSFLDCRFRRRNRRDQMIHLRRENRVVGVPQVDVLR